MRNGSIFGAPSFRPMLGRATPLRGPSLGATERIRGCEVSGHPGWYFLQHTEGASAGGLVATQPFSKAEAEALVGAGNIDWVSSCSMAPGDLLMVLCNITPTTKGSFDILTGQVIGEQPGQISQPHALCPASAAPAPAPSPQPVQPTPVTPLPTVQPAPAPVSSEPQIVIVQMPPPVSAPSPCDAGAWLRQRPVGLGQVRLRRGPF